jgi:hypothetical protein
MPSSPDPRPPIFFEILCGLLLSCGADDRVLEVFLSNHKPSSQSDANARDSAIACSLALQHGCELDTLRKALLRDARGNASTPLGCALDHIAELSA